MSIEVSRYEEFVPEGDHEDDDELCTQAFVALMSDTKVPDDLTCDICGRTVPEAIARMDAILAKERT